MKKFGIKEVVATGIGTALFIVLTEVQIPLGIIPSACPSRPMIPPTTGPNTAARNASTAARGCMDVFGIIPRCDLWNFSWFIRKEL